MSLMYTVDNRFMFLSINKILWIPQIVMPAMHVYTRWGI